LKFVAGGGENRLQFRILSGCHSVTFHFSEQGEKRMTGDKNETRNTAIAAALILVIATAAFYYTPNIVLGIGAYSPVLGVAAGVAIILAFFAVFWLRSKYKK
jgi:hypothetical protein